jgi:soluble lytic murein transglycosylase
MAADPALLNPSGRSVADAGQWQVFSRFLAVCVMAVGLSTALISPAFANTPPPPSRKPINESSRSDLVSTADFSRLREGLRAADAADWANARRQRDAATDGTVRKLLSWAILSQSDSRPSWNELDSGLRLLAGFPGESTVRARTEEAIWNSGLSSLAKVSWLQSGGGPATGQGRAALALALADIGRGTEAAELARDVWRVNVLPIDREQALLTQFPDLGGTGQAWNRADHMLWLGERGAAKRQLARLDADKRALLNARLALMEKARKASDLVRAVPAAEADDPGLLSEQARAKRRLDREEDAIDLISRISATQTLSMVGREAMWDQRRWAAMKLIEAGDYTRAYSVVSGHGLTSGLDYFDAEFLSGWIALRFTRQNDRAQTHFTRLEQAVSSPISRARAAFWLGEAAKGAGRAADADASFARAAEFSTAFYGQLAAERSGRTISLPQPIKPTTADVARFQALEGIRASRLLAELGDTGRFNRVVMAVDDTLTTPEEHQLLAEFAREQMQPGLAIRAAKAGVQRNIIATEAAYPLVEVPPAAQRTRADTALILAISRQESEFNPRAISPVGARGLMQLMPATAKQTARAAGLPYQQSWLLDDPVYNMTIGAKHLEELLDSFSGSFILTAAAYNAGSSRARDWISRFGDPRDRSVDVIDWIERVPFSETRNYIHRVLENVQVYRQRLAGRPISPSLERDMRGR